MDTDNSMTTRTFGRLLEGRPHLIPSVIAALMLLAALGHWPYGYYQLLRFVVCGAGAYVAWLSYCSKYPWAAWLFGFVALLFNPLAPIHLSREIWQPVDLVCAVLFLSAAAVRYEGAPVQRPQTSRPAEYKNEDVRPTP